MFCENCGKQVKDNARFCPNCGLRLAGSDTDSVKQFTKKAKKSFKISSMIPAAVVLAVLVIAVPICVNLVRESRRIDYLVLEEFVDSFPQHGRYEYSAAGRDAFYCEDDLKNWLDQRGWKHYSNQFGDLDITDEAAFEAKNGRWTLKGNTCFEQHDKGDTDYAMGCNVHMSVNTEFEDGEEIYDRCNEIMARYFGDADYPDVTDGQVMWSGYCSSEMAGWVMYDYKNRTVTVSIWDSLQPNLYGTFWYNVPLQSDKGMWNGYAWE